MKTIKPPVWSQGWTPAPRQGSLRGSISCHRTEAAVFSLSLTLCPWKMNKVERSEHFLSAPRHCRPSYQWCMRMCAPTFNSVQQRFKKRGGGGGIWEQMKWADWAQVLLEEENIRSFNVTWRGEKKQLPGEFPFILPQPHRDEMLQQPDSRPSRNNSRKCQTSVSEMRPGEVSSTFYGPPLPPPFTTLSQTRWGQATYKNCYSDTKKSTLLCIHVPAGRLRTASRSIFCHAWWRSINAIAQTNWQPQNSLWLMQALQGPEHPRLVQSIFLMMTTG